MSDHETISSGIAAMLEDETLTTKQRRFIEEYLKVLNGSEAARRAGYSIKCAYQQAYENLRRPKIRGIIDQAIAERSRATLIKAGVIGPDEDPPEIYR